VLSHTHAAVDEIKKKIFKHSPQLFEPPNFIGTIQSFVDTFLAIPFYIQRYHHQPYRIDDDVFREKVKKLASHARYSTLNIWLSKQHDGDAILENLKFDNSDNLISSSILPSKSTKTYNSLCEIKKTTLSDGYLLFEDAFYLANQYVMGFPKIVDIMQKRFAFVFIDEMQDTDTHQSDVLDKIFPATSTSIIQRIGDQNQAIYGHRVKSENIWVPRSGSLSLNGSKRLSASIANTIKNISLEPQVLIGNNQRQNIKPKLLVFGDATIKNVPKKFCDLIIENHLHEVDRPIFKAIGWVKKPKGNGEITVGNYFTNYQPVTRKNKTEFECLCHYFATPDEILTNGFGLSMKNILNAFAKILRMADKKKTDGTSWTAQSLLTFLRDTYPVEHTILRKNIYIWSMALSGGVDVKDDITRYVQQRLANIFSLNTVGVTIGSFLTSGNEQIVAPMQHPASDIFRYQSGDTKLEVEIATIHSIKGETHTATLYLETYYHNDGGKSYESQRLIEQLKGNRVSSKVGKRIKESLKMAYVGMSRPTDLLCVAIHESHIPSTEMDLLQNNWDVIHVA